MRDCIFHNPRCSKSRDTLRLLQDRGVNLAVVNYLEQPPTKSELREICRLLARKPFELVRSKEALFAELGLSKDDGYGDEHWLDVLARHPKLLERPIVIYRGKAALGRPPEQVLALL